MDRGSRCRPQAERIIPLGNIWASISTGKTREVPTLRESAWMEFSETTGIAVAEHAAETGRIATFLLVPVVLDLDRLLAQSFANLEEMSSASCASVAHLAAASHAVWLLDRIWFFPFRLAHPHKQYIATTTATLLRAGVSHFILAEEKIAELNLAPAARPTASK